MKYIQKIVWIFKVDSLLKAFTSSLEIKECLAIIINTTKKNVFIIEMVISVQNLAHLNKSFKYFLLYDLR